MAESASLEAKILVLRHQLNVLSRKSAVARDFSQQGFFPSSALEQTTE